MLVTNRPSLALQVQPAEAARRRGRKRRRELELARRHSPTRRCRGCSKTMREELKLRRRAPRSPCAATSATTSSTTWKKTRAASPGSTCRARLRAPLPARDPRRPHPRQRRRDRPKKTSKEPRYRGLEPGDEIGQEGVEDTYDRYLRGKPGRDPDPGRRLRPADRRTASWSRSGRCPGDNLKLTIDDGVQSAGRRGAGAPAACAAPSSRWTSTPAKSSASARSRPSTRRCSPSPLTQSEVNALYRDPSRAAHRPGDRRPLSDRLDLQDHHRAGGARKRRKSRPRK